MALRDFSFQFSKSLVQRENLHDRVVYGLGTLGVPFNAVHRQPFSFTGLLKSEHSRSVATDLSYSSRLGVQEIWGLGFTC